ncbi:MAG: TonB family protein [Elusimicrobiota bacterium]
MSFFAASPADPILFKRCLGASFALHAGLMLLAGIGLRNPFASSRPVMEIDLSIPLGTGGRRAGPVYEAPPKPLAPKEAPLTQMPPKAPPKPAPAVVPVTALPEARPEPIAAPTAAEPVAEKVNAAADFAPPPLAVPEGAVETPGADAPGGPDGALHGTGSAPLSGGGRGYGEGTGDGTGTGQPLDLLPRLLNKEELLKNLRRFYPESERRAGREGHVLLKLEIGEDGRTAPVEVLRSDGRAFDEAAQKAARTMLFSPAMRRGRPVAVRVPQKFIFQLE